MSIGAYNPWIRSHCTPEQAIEMANAAGAQFIMPVHHQTFRLSFEPFREPITRFEEALRTHTERIALSEMGETFELTLKELCWFQAGFCVGVIALVCSRSSYRSTEIC